MRFWETWIRVMAVTCTFAMIVMIAVLANQYRVSQKMLAAQDSGKFVCPQCGHEFRAAIGLSSK